MTSDRRAELLGVKLAALVRDLDGLDVKAGPLGSTSAAVDGVTTYVLQEDVSPASLGAAILHALRGVSERLVIFADHGGPVAARLAALFGPDLVVEVRTSRGASSEPSVPEPVPVILPGPAGATPLIEVLDSRGLVVLLEEGAWRAEMAGLEVARIVRWPIETGGDGELHIETGVGRFDRDATAAMHGGETSDQALDRVIEIVGSQRSAGAAGHPLCRLARSRWLRSVALRNPAVVGAATLDPVESTFVADSVREERPAAAVGRTEDGVDLVVVFGAGVPLEVVPVALDVRESHAPGALLRIVVPPRDQLAVTEQLVEAADPSLGPVELLDMEAPWSSSAEPS